MAASTRIPLAAGWAMVLAVCVAFPIGWADEPSQDGLGDGPLREFSGEVGRLVKLKIDQSRLLLDRDHWHREIAGKTEAELKEEIIQQWVQRGLPRQFAERRAEQEAQAPHVQRLFQQLQGKAGMHSAGTRSSNNYTRLDFAGPKLAALFERSGHSVRMEFNEQVGLQRRIEIADNGTGGLRLVIATEDGSLILLASQRVDGGFALAELNSTGAFSAQADSFLDFYRDHRDYVEKRFLPLLGHVGMGLPLTRYADTVRRAVLGQIQARRPENQDEFERLVQQLDSEEFETRESATEALIQGFPRFGALARAWVEDDDAVLSPEARSRLGRVVEEFADQEQANLFATAGGLADDVAYLIELLGELDQDDRDVIAIQLAKLTEQDFGPDTSKWKAWLEANADQ